MLATRYEFTHKGGAHTVTFVANRGWSVIRHPAGEVKIPPRGEILTDDGWNPLIPVVEKNPKYYDTAEACYDELTAPTPEEVAAAEKEMDAFGKMSDYFSDRIRQLAIAKKGVSIDESEMDVIYSAYKTDDNGVPIDNLDDVVAEGSFTVCYDGGWGTEWRNTDKKLVNPTWCELAVYADAAIKYSGDKHHVFFEGANVNVVGGEIDLFFGS